MRGARAASRSAVALLAILALWAWREHGGSVADPARDAQIEQLHRAQRSGVFVEAEGVVARLLADDLEGSRHQRFIVHLASGHSLLVSHNIDLAERVAGLEAGDEIAFRGQYEWNERGGVVHWTHRDPRGERPGGWLRHRGRTYR